MSDFCNSYRSCTHASVEEIAPEDAGPQAAQVGLGSSSPLHYQSAPPFDIGAWLTDFGLESDRYHPPPPLSPLLQFLLDSFVCIRA